MKNILLLLLLLPIALCGQQFVAGRENRDSRPGMNSNPIDPRCCQQPDSDRSQLIAGLAEGVASAEIFSLRANVGAGRYRVRDEDVLRADLPDFLEWNHRVEGIRDGGAGHDPQRGFRHCGKRGGFSRQQAPDHRQPNRICQRSLPQIT